MRLRAIHLYAGTGTMTRAFQKHGVDVVLAWEPDKFLAEVYRANFPEVSLWEGPLEEADMSQIPNYDLLLAKVISPPALVGKQIPQNSGVLSVVEKTRPKAFCFVTSGWAGHDQFFREQIIQILVEMDYHVQYRLLDAVNCGGVPFKGRGIYIIGYQQKYVERSFYFPEWIECVPLDTRYLDRDSERVEMLCHQIPEEVRIFIESENAKSGAIYSIQRRFVKDIGNQYQLVNCDYCPKLNQREWYRTYVQSEQGVRRLTWREYLALQGDTETELPGGMANTRIWYCMGQHGLYAVEYRIAERLVELFSERAEIAEESDAVRDRVMVPLYGMVLHMEQREAESADTESGQAFVTEAFKDSLWIEEGQKFLVVAEDRKHAAAYNAELGRLKSVYMANNQMESKELGLNKNILWKRLAESESFFLDSMEEIAAQREIIHRFINCKRGILVVVSTWPGLDIPELSTAYVVGQRKQYELLGIAGRVTRPAVGKNYAKMVFCGCDYEKLLSEDIIEEWPQTHKLVQALWQGDYQKGHSILKQIMAETGSVGRAMERELRFLYPAGCNREDWRELWRESGGSLQLLSTVWCLTSQYAGAFGKKWLDEACRDLPQMAEEAAAQEETKALPEAKAERQDKSEKTFASSYEQGAFLENAVMELLHQLFQLDWESIGDLEAQVSSVLDLLRRQNSGAQGGYDIRVVYQQGVSDKKRICLLECKYMLAKEITIADIAGKLEQVKLAEQDVEHWILVAPCAKFANDVALYLERLERHPGGQLPVKNVQVWSDDNGVKDLFGLIPELYHAIYGGNSEDEDAPEQWPDSQRRYILEHWKQKLIPVALLPNGFLDYPERPECLLFDVQNDRNIRKQYEDLYKRYIRLHYYDSEGRYAEENLETGLEKWLYQSRQTAKILLGEFGDGKTFFLYSFCRRLLEKFRGSPEERYLPICLSLKRMGEGKTAADFIEERMKELGSSRKDFLELKRRYHVLVCLDGLDEMTAEMDSQTQLLNMKRLISCCDELKDVRILITSRTQCFESYNVKDMLRERIGEFDVWKLAQISKEEAKQYLCAVVRERTGGQEEIDMQESSGWLSLAGKPLFVEMMRELWEDDVPVGMSENEIYDRYIHKCLRRKFQEGYNRNDRWVKVEDTIRRIRQALGQIAVRMQEKRRERLDIKEMESFLDMPLVKILWEEDTEDERTSEDARNRFSMRSLFKKEAGGEISFAHRSIREYFMGMYLLELLEKDLPELYVFLERDICSYEVYRFLANGIIGGDREMLMESLLSLLPQCRTTKSVAAAKILQICFLVDVRIPQGEWSGQNLDGVYIPGADLSEQDLSHSSIRNANLNNVKLDDADCSYCDFTGSRLEETTRVEAVGESEEGVRVIYADGIVRDWEPQTMDHEVCWEEPGGYERAVLMKQDWLALRASGQWALYGTGSRLRSMLCYWKDDQMTILDISSTGILLTWKMDADRYLTAVIDCGKNKVMTYWKGNRAVLGKFCDDNAAVVSDGQRVYLWNMESDQEYNFLLPTENFKEIAARRAEGSYHLVLLAEGELILAGYQIGAAVLQKREQPLTLEGIHHVTIVQENYIALGSSGGTVSLIPVNWDTLEVRWEKRKDLQLGIYCRNVKTEGLMPLEVRQRLEMHRG